MEGFERYGKKRVMVVVDHTSQSKHAMMWALTYVANKGDLFTLLHIVSHSNKLSESPDSSSFLANSLGYLCKASRPEVEVEALVIQGPKLETVLSQVKKLECFGAAPEKALSVWLLLRDQQLREACGTVHRPCRLLYNWGSKTDQWHGRSPYQHQVAEELLASSLVLL